MDRVDVIVLSWNRAQLTKETILNVLDQERIPLHVWIIDQGSSLETLQILRPLAQKHSNVTLVELDKNLGVPGGRNFGAWQGQSDLIVFIDNDAIFASADALYRVVHRFEVSPNLGIIGFRILNYFTGKDDEPFWAYPKSQKGMRQQEFVTTRFAGGACAMRRSVFERVGGFDEQLFFYWEEVDLSNRVINDGFQIVYFPDVVVRHKTSPEARVEWKNDRFYYLSRNAIFLHMKYYREFWKTSILALGYLVKGIFNGVSRQAFRGLWDALKMYNQEKSKLEQGKIILSSKAREYIWENELRFRGSLWSRLRNEVFVRLSE